MSMILMRTDLANDMRVIRLSDLTGAKVGAIIGGLHAVWSAAQTLSTDGFIRYMTAARIDRLAEVDGFAAAMVDVGWLKVVPEGAEFPDFDAYFGRSSKSRAIDRLRKSRDRKGKGKGGKPDKPWTQSGQNSDKTRTESGVVRAPTHDKGSERIGKDWNGSHSPPATPGGASESGKVENKPPSTLPVLPVSPESSPPTPPPPASQNPGGTSGPSGAPTQLGASKANGGDAYLPPPSSGYSYVNERADAAGGMPGLKAFREAYPKGFVSAKTEIRDAWVRLGAEADPGPIMAGLAKWKRCERWQAGYAKNAETFLTNRMWEDEPPAPKVKPGQNGQNGHVAPDPDRTAAIAASAKKFAAMSKGEQDAIYEQIYEVHKHLRGQSKEHPVFPSVIHDAMNGTLKRKVAV